MKFSTAGILFLALILNLTGSTVLRAQFNPDHIMSLILSGDYDQATRLLDTSAREERNNAQWHYLKGRLEFRKNNTDNSISYFEKAVSLDSGNALYYLWVGNSNCSTAGSASVLRQPFLARRCKSAYDKTLEFDPMNIEARSSLIRFHLQAPGIVGGSQDEADRLADEISKLIPYRGLQEKYIIANSRNQTENALSLLVEGIETYPDSTWFRYSLAMRMINEKNYTVAYTQLKNLIESDPDSWNYKYQLGRLSALSGQYLDEGVAALESIIQNVPNDMNQSFHSMLFTRYGQIHLHAGRRDAAVSAFNLSLVINPENQVAIEELKKLQ